MSKEQKKSCEVQERNRFSSHDPGRHSSQQICYREKRGALCKINIFITAAVAAEKRPRTQSRELRLKNGRNSMHFDSEGLMVVFSQNTIISSASLQVWKCRSVTCQEKREIPKRKTRKCKFFKCLKCYRALIALFLAPGAVSLKWMLKKMGKEKSNFSEFLDWIAFIFPVSRLHRMGIKAIEIFFRWSSLNPSYEAQNKMQTKKPHFVK